MTRELGATTTVAALALTAFWTMVTIGRIGVAAVERCLPVRVTYHILPFLLAGSLSSSRSCPKAIPPLGCSLSVSPVWGSALLPLTISFGEEQLTAIAAAMAGGVIAFYQLGYGIAAFGVGPLLDGGIKLSGSTVPARLSPQRWGCCRSRWFAAAWLVLPLAQRTSGLEPKAMPASLNPR